MVLYIPSLTVWPDTVGVEHAINYIRATTKIEDAFSQFLNERSYIHPDYLYDIAGTQCLRNMRYADAVEFFSHINIPSNHQLNLTIDYHPFSIDEEAIASHPRFRYEFAKKMLYLERAIQKVSRPNVKAILMVKFATGLRNSFGNCWELTQYCKGENYLYRYGKKHYWEYHQLTQAARERANQLIETATATASFEWLAAEIQYAHHQYRTVAQKYPDTFAGRRVRGACDQWIDYQIR